jgi:hypothetical protein
LENQTGKSAIAENVNIVAAPVVQIAVAAKHAIHLKILIFVFIEVSENA